MWRRSFIVKAVEILMMVFLCRFGAGRVPVGYKIATTIETTSICNLACPFCPTARTKPVIKRRRKFISAKHFHRIIEKTTGFTRTYVLSMWGEPLLHPDFFNFLDALKNKTVYFATNLNFSPKIAERLAGYAVNIHCSVDTVEPETYPAYRVGGRHATVVENIRILAQGACTVHPTFFQDEARARAFAADLGIPAEQVMMITMFDTRDNTALSGRRQTEFHCDSLHRGLYFTSDGDLTACCISHQPDLVFANIDDFSEGEFLNDPRVTAMRARVYGDKNQFASCRACRNETLPVILAKRVRRLMARGVG